MYIPSYKTFENIQIFSNNIIKLQNEPPTDVFLITGDFNLPNINWAHQESDIFLSLSFKSDLKSTIFLDCCEITNLIQFNNIKNYHNNIIDLIFCTKDRSNVSECYDTIVKEDVL